MTIYMWPWLKNTVISQLFGKNAGGVNPSGGHTGTDAALPLNTPIYAPGDGVIEHADWFRTATGSDNPWWLTAGGGISVVLNCGNDAPTFVFSHLNRTDLNKGDRVKKGQIIGYSGNTGTWTTGPHLHFEALPPEYNLNSNTYGRVNPALYCKEYKDSITLAPSSSLAANQRKAGPEGVNQRATASSSGKIVRFIQPNTIETFTGYVIGESISGINVWYKDAQGYAWAGGFTSQSVSGLTNLTPKPPAPSLAANQRKVGADNTNMRTEASTASTSKVVGVIPAGSVATFTGYVIGQPISGINIWYKHPNGYAWAGGFTSQATTGLTNLTPAPAPAPTPTPTPEPIEKPYSFTKDFDFVEYVPAANGNFQLGNFPEKPEKVVIHQFGTVGVDTLQSTLNTFTNPNLERVVSAHFVVSGKRIIQLVSLKDRAYHAGSTGNNYVGIETDPAQDADTIASTKKLLQALKNKYGYELVKTLHKDVPGNSTNCGASITLSKYDLTPPVVVPVPDPTPVVDKEAIIDDFLGFLKTEYLNRDK